MSYVELPRNTLDLRSRHYGESTQRLSDPQAARYSGCPTEPGVVIRGDTIWAVERDEFDVETVVRYAVPGLPTAGGE